MSAIGPPHLPDRQERPPKINVCGLRSQKVTSSSSLVALIFPLWYVCYSATAGGGRETETEDASYVDTGYIWFEMMCLLCGTWIASTPIVHNVNSPLCPHLSRTSGAQKYLFRCCLPLPLLLLLLSLPSVGRRRGERRSLLGCDHPEREQFVSISRVKGLARRPPSRRPHLKHASSNQTCIAVLPNISRSLYLCFIFILRIVGQLSHSFKSLFRV